jgi:hypothetical protein
MRNRFHKPASTKPYRRICGWGFDRSHIIGSVDGFVSARNHRQIPEIVNEPAQPRQQISIVIRLSVDDDIRSGMDDSIRSIVGIWGGDVRSYLGDSNV